MASDILVVYAYLDTLADRAQAAATSMSESSRLSNLTFPEDDPVEDAYHDFLGRWDEHREALVEAIGAAGAAFRAVSEAFAATEDELIAALGGG